MSSQKAQNLKAGYRTVGLLLLVGFASIGFTRLEDRAIIGIPGSPANAMAAFAGTAPVGENYDGNPEGYVSIDRASGVPASRIRRVLRDRDVPRAAARQIVSPSPSPLAPPAGDVIDGGASPVVAQALAPVASQPAGFSSLAPSSPGTGTPVFAASLTPANTGGGGAGGGGGSGGQDGGGGGTDGGPTTPVTAVPEPSTWLMLIFGFFAVGGALRRKAPMLRKTAFAAN